MVFFIVSSPERPADFATGEIVASSKESVASAPAPAFHSWNMYKCLLCREYRRKLDDTAAEFVKSIRLETDLRRRSWTPFRQDRALLRIKDGETE